MTDDAAHHTGSNHPATPQQRRAMRTAVVAQCFGTPAYVLLTRGFVLVYLTTLGIDSTRVLMYLALPEFVIAALRIPGALSADRRGIKRLGLPGLMLTTLGIVILALAPQAGQARVELVIALGIVVFAVGEAMMEAGWFALLSPIVPQAIRGRFFGRLRTSWQLVCVIFVAVCGVALTHDSSVFTYQWLLGAAAAGQAVRVWLYAQLPELEPPAGKPQPVRAAFDHVIRAPGYISFCAYIMLLGMCTGGIVNLFGMVEKDVLQLSDNRVVWLGNVTMIGAVIGFFLGGRAVDRYSTKPVFLVCHFGYGLVLALFLARHLAGQALFEALAVVHLLLGVLSAASSIAISTELLALIPPANKSLSTSLAGVMWRMSAAVSGLLAAWVLEKQLLAEQWSLAGAVFSAYDSILLLWGVMVIMFVVTLGLVPSVMRKAEWVPGS